MNETTIYITGAPGFKSTVITKLGREWVHAAQDIGQDVVSFVLPENSTLEDLKTSIGPEILSDHSIQFSEEPPAEHRPYTKLKYIPGQPIKMSIWVNRDSRLSGNGSNHDDNK